MWEREGERESKMEIGKNKKKEKIERERESGAYRERHNQFKKFNKEVKSDNFCYHNMGKMNILKGYQISFCIFGAPIIFLSIVCTM